jgi:hypothetical protein
MKPHTVAIVILTILVLACNDHGVPEERPQAQSAPPSAPPLVSSRVDPSAPLPPGHPPLDAGGGSTLPPVPEGAGSGESALAWTAPKGWIAEAPTSPMRRAQYRVPGKAGDGECVVFYFGPGQGGDPMANAERWAGQFTLEDGRPALGAMTTTEIDVQGLKVTLVEVAGTYDGGMTMGTAPATPKPGYRLLGAVAPGPDANWFFKFTGPDRTVVEHHAAFESMVRSLKHGA